jgi:hypothetical protein
MPQQTSSYSPKITQRTTSDASLASSGPIIKDDSGNGSKQCSDIKAFLINVAHRELPFHKSYNLKNMRTDPRNS